MAVPTIVLEAWLGGSWVDISAWLKTAEGYDVEIHRGREDSQSAVNPGTCEFYLANHDGRFSEGGSTYPDWKQWVPVRVTANSVVRFNGYATSIEAEPDGRVDRSLCHVTAVDAKAIMAASPAPLVVSDAAIASLGPVAWWKMDDSAGSIAAADTIGSNHLPIASTGTSDPTPESWVFGTEPPTGLSTGKMLELTDAAVDPVLRGPVALPSATSFTVVLVHIPPGSLDGDLLWLDQSDVSDSLYLYRSTGGDLVVGGVAGDVTTAGFFTADTPKLVAVSFTPTQVRVLGSATSFTPTALHTLDWYTRAVMGGAGATGIYGNAFILPYALSVNDYAILRALILEGGTTQPVTAWMQTALDLAGVNATAVALGYDRPMRNPALAGQSPAAIGDSLAEAAGAMFVCNRTTGAPTWIDHLHVGTMTHIPDTHLHLPALKHAADRSLRVTDVDSEGATLAAAGPSVWPRQSRTLDPLLPSPNIVDYAQWLVNTSEIMASARLTGLRINLNRDTITAADYLALDLKDRVIVDDPPTWAPGDWVNTIEGYEEHLAFDNWWIEFNTAPDPRFIIEDPIAGVVEAGYRIGY